MKNLRVYWEKKMIRPSQSLQIGDSYVIFLIQPSIGEYNLILATPENADDAENLNKIHVY